MNQTYFPRGGAKDNPIIQFRKFVFEKKKQPKSNKKNRRKEKESNESHPPHFIKSPILQEKLHHLHLNSTDLTVGFQCVCAIDGIIKDRLFVNLPFGRRAMIFKSEISEPYSQLLKSGEESKDLRKMFFMGQLLSCKIIKCEVDNNKIIGVHATLKPSSINWNVNSGMVKKHTMLQMAVASVEDHGYFMESGVTGVTAFLPFKEASKYSKQVLGCRQILSVGTVMWCYVLKSTVNSSGANILEVTIDPNKTSESKCIQPSNILWPGARVGCTITKIYEDGCCQILVNGSKIQGTVDYALNFSTESNNDFSEGSSYPATVISYNPLTNVSYFSFSHHVGNTNIPFISRQDNVKNCTSICKATVEKVNKLFAYLTLDQMKFKGYMFVNTKRNKETEKPKNECVTETNDTSFHFKPGDVINVTIKQLDLFKRMYFCQISSKQIDGDSKDTKKSKKKRDKALNHIEIKEELDSDLEASSEVEIKDEVDSDVDNQDDSGIDVEKNSSKTQSELNKSKKKKRKMDSDSNIEYDNVEMQEFDSNQSIKDEVLSDSESDFQSNELEEDVSSDSKIIDLKENNKKRKNTNENSEIPGKKKLRNDKPESSSSKNKPVINEIIKKKLEAVNNMSLKEVDSTFLWDATPDDLARITNNDVEEFNEESDEEKPVKKSLSKKQKKFNELEKERKIREKEEELLKALEDPKSADHYERLILSKPDDSSVWVKYMAYYLEATEIEKARNVAKRALKLISHRNEQDRLNIWLALLNLEHLYGSKDLFKETWVEALKSNDDYKINCKVMDMYTNDSNTMEVSNLVQKMTKQYRENSDCWFTCLSALMSTGLKDKARALLQKGLKALPPKSHVTLISRFAVLENSFGHSEEGQALFDNLLTSYPARVDIWFVYIDMLIKSDMLDLARQVFERATNNKLPAKKMKSIYKKWLEFEEKNGTEEDVENVRKSATLYVEKASNEIGS